MPLFFDAEVSDAGSASWVGFQEVLYVATHVVTLGPGVRSAGDQVDDHVLRVGFWALGDNFAIAPDAAHDWWHPPVWCDFVDQLWTPVPSTDAAHQALALFASRVRWAFGLGTTVHLTVFGR